MAKKMLIDATHAEETRVVVADGTRLEEFDFESITKKQLAGNIYLAKVMRVEPSLQAAFVDYGGNRHGFLAFSEIHPDYYQIPKAERDALVAAMARDSDNDNDDEDEKPRAKRSRSNDDSDRGSSRRGSRRNTRQRRSGSRGGSVKRNRSGAIIEREFRISGGMKVRLLRDDDGTDIEQEFKLDDGTRVRLVNETPRQEEAPKKRSGSRRGGRRNGVERQFKLSDGTKVRLSPYRTRKTMPMSAALDDKISGDADEIAEMPDEVGGDDAREEVRPVRKPRIRDYKIQDVIKKKQILLIQVVKEERGSKGAAVTTYMSLAGRYCVLMPNTARGGGISRKITHVSDRKKLKEIAGEMEVPKGMGLIIRTAGAQRTRAEITRDYEYLLRQWESVRDLTLQSYAPALIYEEGNLIKRSIRDLYAKDIDEILVEGEEGCREAKDYMTMLMPTHAKNVKPYHDQTPLFVRYQVENQLAGMFNPTVQLKSGGYIVIGITEALVAIDVNSGRSTRAGSIEDTAVNTNLEAADEVARQLRLRDLAGLIVIDFIDMDRSSNNRAVEKRMKDRLATDRARLQIGRISSFGLMEMSRQRLRPGMLEASTTECPHCHGSGLVRSDESLALTILRDVEEEGVKGRSAVVTVKAPVSIANFLLNHKRDRVMSIEDRYNLRVVVEGDPHLIQPNYSLEKLKEDEAPESLRRPARPSIKVETSFDDDPVEDAVIVEDDAPTPAPSAKSDDDDADDRSRRRGKRGGRGRKKPDEADPLRVIDLDDDNSGEKPFQYGDEKAKKDDGERSNERRGQRGGRKRERAERGKLGNREMAEAAATSMLSGRDALDDALPSLFADTANANPKKATKPQPKPKRARRNPKADVAEQTPEAAPIEAEVKPTTTEQPVKAKAKAPAAEKVVAEPQTPTEPPAAATSTPEPAATKPEPKAEPDPLSVKAPPTPPRDAPKKRGWWSRGKTGS